MSPVVAARVAWSIVVAAVVLSAAGLAMSVVGLELADRYLLVEGMVAALGLVAALVGGLVASRRPSNPIGWIFCGFVVSLSVSLLTAGLVRVAPADGTRGVGQAAAWISNPGWVALAPLAIFVLLLFPDGRLLSPRWRAAAWCGALGTAMLAAGAALEPGPFVDFPQVTNPLGVDRALSEAFLTVGLILVALASAAALSAAVIRYRRADAVARQQIKWLAAAGVFTAVVTGAGAVAIVSGVDAPGYAMTILGVLAIPAAIAVAMLRHNLYDIDRLISRSLTYGLMTAALAAIYAGLVLGGQTLFSRIAGGSSLVIAASTLVVAALFLPLRGRVQGLVDRRFYRRRYDARRTVDAFGARLREQVELDALRADLAGVVRETMQPAQVSVWLRQEGSP